MNQSNSRNAPLNRYQRLPDGVHPEPGTTTRRVLVADDNTELAHSMVMILRVEGFNAQYAFTGLDAVLMTRRWQPQVILLDLTMPQGNGWEVASALRSGLAPECLLIAHSALDAPEDIDRCTQSGFDAHFTKPCDLDALLLLLQCYYTVGAAWRHTAPYGGGGRINTFPSQPR